MSARVRWSSCVVLVSCLGPLLVHCKDQPTDDVPLDMLKPAQLAKEKKLASSGETVGEPLRAPRVVLDAKDVTINGRRVASRSDLSSVAVIDSIFQWAKGLREHWKALYPGRDLDPHADVTFPSDATWVEGAALLHTLAYAGFAYDLMARMGTLTVRLHYDDLQPLEETEGAAKALVDLSESGGWRARRAVDDESREAVATSLGHADCAPWQPLDVTNAAAIASGICKKKCDIVIVSGGPSFQAVLEILAVVLPRAEPRVKVGFVATERCK